MTTNKKVLIVGGVAGGASAAARLRRMDEHAEIIMFERDPYISFANCGLPYYIGGSIAERSKLLVQTPEAMKARFNIDVRPESEVIAVHADRKTVTVASKDKGTYEESYDYLILSPGAKPIRPNLPGIKSEKIHTLRNIPDTDRVKKKVTEEGTRSAVVIGGGFIGVEMAENLRELGLDVSLVEAGPQLLAPFDAEMSSLLSRELEDHGVRLHLSNGVQSFEDDGDAIAVTLADGIRLEADLVLLAIGVSPDTGFLQGSGIVLGPRGHILVDDKLQTNVPNIYAAGDAVEIVDFVNGAKTAIPLAGPANKQGRIVADNVSGLGVSYNGSQGTSIIKVFGLTGAATGNNEKTLKRLGIACRTVYVHPNSHAGYYPGAVPISMKLLFGDDGKLLGAQAVGREGVDKRMDVIATVMRMRGTVADLTELELSYAPPYSSAKDPVNMLGYAAENVLAGRTDVFVPADLEGRDPSATVLVDVRSELEHKGGHIPDSILIPVDDLRSRLAELDRDKEIWVYCQVGLRGYTASRILMQHGFKVKNLTGGFRTYQMTQYKPKASSDGPVAPVPSSAQSANISQEAPASAEAPALTLDACGLCCPGPLIQVKDSMDRLVDGQTLRVVATDPGFYEDIKAWVRMSGHELLRIEKQPSGRIEALICKSSGLSRPSATSTASSDGATMVVFSGDLDKAIASFIIANGAAASGKKVTMFFTFWGLNVIRKPERISVKKSLVGRMFGAMMPRGSKKLGLSRMNMGGMGAKMIRGIMRSNNVASLEELIQTAVRQGVDIVGCQMSMDLMGISKEELIDGVRIAGVGAYLGKADQAGVNLFI